MSDFAKAVLEWTLFGYILTLIFVTYVGVPVIVITGVISYFCEK